MHTQPIGTDIPWVQYRYNLRGLAPNKRCPECGTAISRTLAEARRRVLDADRARSLHEIKIEECKTPVLVLGVSFVVIIGHAALSGSIHEAVGLPQGGALFLPFLDAAAGALGFVLAAGILWWQLRPDPVDLIYIIRIVWFPRVITFVWFTGVVATH